MLLMIGITWSKTNFSVFFHFRLFVIFLWKSSLTFNVLNAVILMSFLKQIKQKLIAGQFPLMWFKMPLVLLSWYLTRVMCLDWIHVCASGVFYSFLYWLSQRHRQHSNIRRTVPLGIWSPNDKCESHPVLLWNWSPEVALFIPADLMVERRAADRGVRRLEAGGGPNRGPVGLLERWHLCEGVTLDTRCSSDPDLNCFQLVSHEDKRVDLPDSAVRGGHYNRHR